MEPQSRMGKAVLTGSLPLPLPSCLSLRGGHEDPRKSWVASSFPFQNNVKGDANSNCSQKLYLDVYGEVVTNL